MTRNWPRGTDSTVIHVHAGPLTSVARGFHIERGAKMEGGGVEGLSERLDLSINYHRASVVIVAKV